MHLHGPAHPKGNFKWEKTASTFLQPTFIVAKFTYCWIQNIYEDFPGDSVTKIPSAGRPGLIPGQGARSHMLQPGAAK